ncbi:MAG: ATP-dependent helicase [Anaerolineaceae bacterium]
MFKPRPSQQKILDYTGGMMGISAVPGSGKTHSLSMLAARLLADGKIAEAEGEEILIVTFSNSAVNNFANRIDGFIREQGLLPAFGYRVRTLHGLAHDIIRERPDRVGLSNEFQIIPEYEADLLLNTLCQNFLRGHPDWLLPYLKETIDTTQSRFKKDSLDLLVAVAGSFIRQAKDLQAGTDFLDNRLQSIAHQDPLLECCVEIYREYQRSLSFRSAVDFDDLIRLSLECLESDPEYLFRLQERWPFILEDEAQDSSRLQEKILRILTSRRGNWVRVGDPNQSLLDTFTSSNPHFLRDFLKEDGVTPVDLPTSGRSTSSIMELANYLIEWTRTDHPVSELRSALTRPLIQGTGPNDPQPNPPDQPNSVVLFMRKSSSVDELDNITRSLKAWLPAHPDQTVAVLAPTNSRGAEIISELKKAGLETVELLRTSAETRRTADIIAKILRFLAFPCQDVNLIHLHKLWQDIHDQIGEEAFNKTAHTLIRGCKRLEDYLRPQPGQDWLSNRPQPLGDMVLGQLIKFREDLKKWQAAVDLPIDQLVITISQDLFTRPSDLAMAYKIAVMLESSGKVHPEWQFPQFCDECEQLAANRRRMLGFSEEDTGFNPDLHKGKVAVCTMHKAKGMEWDRVYLTSVNNYDFPSAQDFDTFIEEKNFIRGQLNLNAEIIARLRLLEAGGGSAAFLPEGMATLEARRDYAAERLRLLFVGITRAKKELIITWNTGRYENMKPAIPLTALSLFWENKKDAPPA